MPEFQHPTPNTLSPLRVSEDRRFLLHSDGTPFFYLGDTAWELFHRLTREEADLYLETRAAQGFTVIQAVALAEFDGLRVPNAYGHLPLHDLDPTRPNEDYFRHVDYIVNKANELGMFVGLLPTWGDKINQKWGEGPEVFTPENAYVFGEWIAKRYAEHNIIWILGGDRELETETQKLIIYEMAEGIGVGGRSGDKKEGNQLIAFHPQGGRHSSEYFQNDAWLAFNMIQSGHNRNKANYEMIAHDYALTPTKPCIDAEPGYEDHPAGFDQKNGYLMDYDTRKSLYWSLFAGACGHTYGCHSMWQFWAEGREPVNRPLRYWQWAVQLPGAWQQQYGRKLIESRPVLSRIPDPSLLVLATGDENRGGGHLAATRCRDGNYAFVYSPLGETFTVDLEKLSGDTLEGAWYCPRTGFSFPFGTFPRQGQREFTPPSSGLYHDWVLILDGH